MQNDTERVQSPESSSLPPAAMDPTSWQTSRLLWAVIVCAVIIGAAVAFEALG